MANFTVENVFGIGSFRLCAGFPSSIKSAESTGDYLYEFPLNGCLVVQNYSRDERLHFEHVYDDIIVVMLYNLYTNQVLTCSYSGKIILWSHNYQRRFVEQQVRIDHVFYGHWTRDGTTIYLCSRFDGTIISLSYDAQHYSLTENWLRHWATPHRDIQPVDVSSSSDPATKIETSNTYVAGSIGYEFLVCTAMRRHVFAVLQRPQEHVRIHQLNLQDGHLLSDLKLEPAKATQTFLCGTTETFLDSKTNKEYFAIGLQSGLIFILCTDHLHIHRVITASGTPQAMIWSNSALLTVGYISTLINAFSLDGTLIGSASGAPATAVCHLHWSNDEKNALWIGGYMGLTLMEIELALPRSPSPAPTMMFTILNYVAEEKPSSITTNTLFHRTLHETAGCGLFLDDDRIYSGDLSGNIFQWAIDEHQPKRHVTIPDSVRCFISENLVGTLSGVIYQLDTGEIVEDCKSTVICSAWNRAKTSCLVGLGDGRLIDLQNKSLVGLHDGNVEIWSVCWSPDETRCATASEDQTTCVWRIGVEQELVATLRGHTTAVTSVQWKNERIYTCADDRTVRIYESHSADYSCLHVLRTPKSLFGWFTLTYLQVDEEKRWIMTVTQNGYLVVWKENDHEENQDELPILCKKIHFGSLEGFVYDRSRCRAVVIGSDCSVSCLRFS